MNIILDLIAIHRHWIDRRIIIFKIKDCDPSPLDRSPDHHFQNQGL
jgi:hypothetical protein